ncbi:MAG: hypothetical protein MJZ66_10375 [Bacteroidales bacterium]|nr:hypothetical protein [Bacteroidales bacterium]
MTIDDMFELVFRQNAFPVSEAEDLDILRRGLEVNYEKVALFFQEDDNFEAAVLDALFEDALLTKFDEDIIRRALELGYYPMAMRGRVLHEYDLDESVLDKKESDSFLDFVFGSYGKGVYRATPTIRYHVIKLIIKPEDLHVSKKFRGWVEGKFSDCTLCFNRNFDLCMSELIQAYPDTWLFPPLVKILKNIHDNPGKVSVDSVELWRGNELIAGEIGFVTKNAYASLSGFHKESDSGTVQMLALGKYLFQNGFAYWDLGMEIEYKYRFGAKDYDRNGQEALYDTLSGERLEFTDKAVPLKDLL